MQSPVSVLHRLEHTSLGPLSSCLATFVSRVM